MGRGRRGQEGKEGWVHESEGWQVPWEGQMCREGRLVHSGDPGSISFPAFRGLLPLTSVHRGLQREWGTVPRYLRVCPSHLQGEGKCGCHGRLEGAPSSAPVTQLTFLSCSVSWSSRRA